jgi:hypothetical protein
LPFRGPSGQRTLVKNTKPKEETRRPTRALSAGAKRRCSMRQAPLGCIGLAGFATVVCQLLVPHEPSIVLGGWQPPVAWGFETVLENSKGTLTKFPSTDCYHFTFIALEQPSIRVRGASQPPSARAGSFLTAVNARRIGFASLSGALTWRSNSPGIYFAMLTPSESTARDVRVFRSPVQAVAALLRKEIDYRERL